MLQRSNEEGENQHTNMTRLLASTALTAVVVMGVVPAANAASRSYYGAANDRYCLQGRIWDYPGNCQFATYGQCRASASGTDAHCGINPRYAFARRQSYR